MIWTWLRSLWDKFMGRSVDLQEETPDWSGVPKTLDEAVDQFIKDTEGDEELKDLLEKEESSFLGYLHFGGGMNMRNEWGFWNHEHPSDLAKWFHERGIYHADDMSGIVYRTFYRRLKGEDEAVQEQIENLRQYWRDQGQDPDRLFEPPQTN